MAGQPGQLGVSRRPARPYNPAVHAAMAAADAMFIMLPLAVRPDLAYPAGLLPQLCLSTLCFILASPIAWEPSRRPRRDVHRRGRHGDGVAARQGAADVCSHPSRGLAAVREQARYAGEPAERYGAEPSAGDHLAGALMLLIVLSWQIRSRRQGRRRPVPTADPVHKSLERRLWP